MAVFWSDTEVNVRTTINSQLHYHLSHSPSLTYPVPFLSQWIKVRHVHLATELIVLLTRRREVLGLAALLSSCSWAPLSPGFEEETL